jgi:putative YhdH/YhfP family quinone oxidoreductase
MAIVTLTMEDGRRAAKYCVPTPSVGTRKSRAEGRALVLDMSHSSAVPAYVVRKDSAGRVSARVEPITPDMLPPGDVLIRVAYSSLNYKDALACQGHPGVVRTFPHVPGVDCSGTVLESTAAACRSGDEVLVTGYELGAGQWGGFAELVRVPAEWIVALPAGLSLREAMIYGTAGFTAAQSVTAIVERGITPDRGPVVVTGATGGVGCLAVAILAKLGYEVTAVTGKSERADWLRRLGAKTILSRSDILDDSDRPLLPARWAAAIDTVGGRPLATILRSTQHRAVVAACGLVAGPELPLTVYPFILRGVTLAGIDSAKCPRPQRLEMWQKLAGRWRIERLDDLAEEVTLDELPDRVQKILAGQNVGRTLIVPQSAQLDL